MGRTIALAVGVFIAVLFVDLLASPGLLALLDRLRPLTPELAVRLHLLLFVGAFAVLAAERCLAFVSNVPGRVVFGLVGLGLATVACVLVFDRADFKTEASWMTAATSSVLLVASLAAAVNVRLQRGALLRLFWLGLCGAFFFAALDELLMFHERVGEWLGGRDPYEEGIASADLVTLLYALGAAVFVGVFLAWVARPLLGRGRWFAPVLVGAVLVYGLSTALDTWDESFARPGSFTDFRYLANCVEEVLELVAATLFLASFVTAALEREDGRLVQRLGAGLLGARAPGLRGLLAIGGLASGCVLLALGILYRPDDSIVTDPERFQVELVADHRMGLAGVDGIALHRGHVYLTNDSAGFVLDLAPDGSRRIVADREDGLVSPESVAVSADGTVYIADDRAGAVFEIRGDESRVLLDHRHGLESPEGLALDRSGALYVADEDAHTIFRHRAGVVEVVAGPDEIGEPEEIAIDGQGRLYATDPARSEVVRVTRDGVTRFAGPEQGLRRPDAIAIAGDQVYVTDSTEGIIFRFDLEGAGAPYVTMTHRYRALEGLAVDEDGALYAVSGQPTLGGRVFRITEREPAP